MRYPEAIKLITDTLWRVSQDELSDFIEDIMTPAEITDLADRIALLTQLKAGKTQREVAEDMGMSVTTVSRGARVLKYGTGVVEKYV